MLGGVGCAAARVARASFSLPSRRVAPGVHNSEAVCGMAGEVPVRRLKAPYYALSRAWGNSMSPPRPPDSVRIMLLSTRITRLIPPASGCDAAPSRNRSRRLNCMIMASATTGSSLTREGSLDPHSCALGIARSGSRSGRRVHCLDKCDCLTTGTLVHRLTLCQST